MCSTIFNNKYCYISWFARSLAVLLIFVQFISSILLSYLIGINTVTAAQTITPPHNIQQNPIEHIVPDGSTNTTLDRAQNGTPVINIATPSQSGVSVNHYRDYNVQKDNLILNNHQGAVKTSQLGGALYGNPNYNLPGTRPADIILNEVSSNRISRLEGYTEIFGKKAELIIANPNGIMVQGAGFINTSRLALVIGKAQPLDIKGRLTGFQLSNQPQATIQIVGRNLYNDKGEPVIYNLGIDAQNVDYVALLSQAVHLDGDIYTKDLEIQTGNHQVTRHSQNQTYTVHSQDTDMQSETTTEYAIDSTIFGGVYADRINFVATQKGIGVRNRSDLIAEVGDINITAKGDIELGTASDPSKLLAKQDIVLRVDQEQGQLTNHGEIMAHNGNVKVQMDGGTIDNSGAITAGQQLQLQADTVNNLGTKSILQAMDEINIEAVEVNNRRGTILAQKQLNIDTTGKTGGKIYNQGQIISGEDMQLETAELINDQVAKMEGAEAKSPALIQAQGDIRLKTSQLVNNKDNVILAQGKMVIQTDQGEINNHGTLVAGKRLEIHNVGGKLYNQQQILSDGTLWLHTDTLNNQGASALIQAGDGLELSARILLNQSGANLLGQADGKLLILEQLLNDGNIIGQQKLQIITLCTGSIANNNYLAAGELWIQTGTLTNNNLQSFIYSLGKLVITTDTLDNRHTMVPNNHNTGIYAAGSATLGITNWLNQSGRFTVEGDIMLQNYNGNGNNTLLQNQQGSLVGYGTVNLYSDNLINRNGGYIYAQDNLWMINLDNAGGTVESSGQTVQIHNLTVSHSGLNNQQGHISALSDQGQLNIKTLQGINNAEGQIGSNNDATIDSRYGQKLEGTLLIQGNLSLQAQQLINLGNIKVGGDLIVIATNGFINGLVAQEDLASLMVYGNLQITIGQGDFYNYGHLNGYNLALQVSGGIYNELDAVMAAEHTLSLTAGNSIINRGYFSSNLGNTILTVKNDRVIDVGSINETDNNKALDPARVKERQKLWARFEELDEDELLNLLHDTDDATEYQKINERLRWLDIQTLVAEIHSKYTFDPDDWNNLDNAEVQEVLQNLLGDEYLKYTDSQWIVEGLDEYLTHPTTPTEGITEPPAELAAALEIRNQKIREALDTKLQEYQKYLDLDWPTLAEEQLQQKLQDMLGKDYVAENWQIQDFDIYIKANAQMNQPQTNLEFNLAKQAVLDTTSGIHNYGQIASQNLVQLNSPTSVVNYDGALIFAGDSLDINVKQLMQNNAGGLGLGLWAKNYLEISQADAEDGSKGRVKTFINADGTIETHEGDILINADSVANLRAHIPYQSQYLYYDYKKDGSHHYYVYKYILKGTPSRGGEIRSGNNLIINANNLLNNYSLLQAKNHIIIDAVNLNNNSLYLWTGKREEWEGKYRNHFSPTIFNLEPEDYQNYSAVYNSEQKKTTYYAKLTQQGEEKIAKTDPWALEVIKQKTPWWRSTKRYEFGRTFNRKQFILSVTPDCGENGWRCWGSGGKWGYHSEKLFVEQEYNLQGKIVAGGTNYIKATNNLGNGLKLDNQEILETQLRISDTSLHNPVLKKLQQTGSLDPLDKMTLPQGKYGIFRPADTSHSPYVFETNPNLAEVFGKGVGYKPEAGDDLVAEKDFLGSEYFMKRLGLDPQQVDAKFLGDQYFEQQLLQRTMEQLSFTSDYHNGLAGMEQLDYEGKIATLYNNATPELVEKLGLKFGEPLTSEQLDDLTEDIIWYTKETITLADGRHLDNVLVPHIYLTQESREHLNLDDTGSLISGKSLLIDVGNNLTNSGSSLEADAGDLWIKTDNDLNNLNNAKIRNTSKDAKNTQTQLLVKHNLNNIGSLMDSQGDMVAQVLNNLNNITTTVRDTKIYGYYDSIRNQASMSSQAGNLILNVEGKATIQGGEILAKKALQLMADKGVDLETVILEDYYRRETKSGGGFHAKKTRIDEEYSRNNIGSVVAGGAVQIQTNGHLNSTNTTFMAENGIDLESKGKLQLKTAENLHQESHSVIKKKWDSSGHAWGNASSDRINDGNHFLSQRGDVNLMGTEGIDSYASDVQILEEGDNHIRLLSGYTRDADGNLTETNPQADLNLFEVHDQHESSEFDKKWGGLGDFLSNLDIDMNRHGLSVSGTIHSSSYAYQEAGKFSQGNNFSGKTSLLLGSTDDIYAENTQVEIQKDIDLVTEHGNIITVAGTNSYSKNEQHQETDLTLGVKVGNAYLDAHNALQDMQQARKNASTARDNLQQLKQLNDEGKATSDAVEDAQMNVIAATTNQALAISQTDSALKNAISNKTILGGFYGSAFADTHSKITEHEVDEQRHSMSNFHSLEGDINYKSGDSIHQIGTNTISDEGNIRYKAVKEIKVESAVDTYLADARNHNTDTHMELSSSFGINLDKSLSGLNNLNGSIGASGGKDSSHSKQETNLHSHIIAEKGRVTLETTNDTQGKIILAGAQAKAKDVDVKSHDLEITSRLDKLQSQHKDSSWNAGAGGTIKPDTPPNVQLAGLNAKPVYSQNLNVGGSSSHGTAERQTINQDDISGILALGGETNLQISKNTELNGGQVGAIDPLTGQDSGKLNFKTGSLTTHDLDIYNRSSTKGNGLNTKLGKANNTDSDAGKIPMGATNISITDQRHRLEGELQSTIGKGHIEFTDDAQESRTTSERILAQTNRDLQQSIKILLDQVDAASDQNWSLDHRMFSRDGLKDLANNMWEMPKYLGSAVQDVIEFTQHLTYIIYNTPILGDILKTSMGILAEIPFSPAWWSRYIDRNNTEIQNHKDGTKTTRENGAPSLQIGVDSGIKPTVGMQDCGKDKIACRLLPSDESLPLKTLFYWIPGMKDFSLWHDAEMNNDGNPRGTFITMLSIPFFIPLAYLGMLGTYMDPQNFQNTDTLTKIGSTHDTVEKQDKPGTTTKNSNREKSPSKFKQWLKSIHKKFENLAEYWFKLCDKIEEWLWK